MGEDIKNNLSDYHTGYSHTHSAHTFNYDDLKKELQKKKKEDLEPYKPIDRAKNIREEVEQIRRKREVIKNTAREQDIVLKRYTLFSLFIFLAVETALIFIFSYLQATNTLRFHLEEWSFKLLVAATITQITYMLQVAVKHLFPNKRN